MHNEPTANVSTTSDTNSSTSHTVFIQAARKGSVCGITASRSPLAQIIQQNPQSIIS
ncbi:MAG: hypothetical protein AVDCRST_MAG96-4213 [uncultured Segetibacter sp.]|uniref:Uncharacterized protein n=1 Tax=uncultured Segetibacter sp. TaxID=481133 RepID=A0A6J4U435_9BACT|nr:MAG: hypothetical protein AVDCRST_MAG96-4213 [uncultured Segetibacter sp.]